MIDNKLVYKHAMALGEMALAVRSNYSARAIYKKAMSVSSADNLPLVTALYAKSLLLDNEKEKADSIIEPLFIQLAKSSFSSIGEATAYLELFETDIKYISSDYDDKRDDLQLLKEIENNYLNPLYHQLSV